jgi:putative hemolysin
MKSDPLETKRRLADTRQRSGIGAIGYISIALILIPIGVSIVWLTAAHPDSGPSPSSLFAAVGAMVVVVIVNALFGASATVIDILRPMHLTVLEDDEKGQDRLDDIMDHRGHYAATSELGALSMRAWLILLCILPAREAAGWMTSWGWLPNPDTIGAILAGAILISIPVSIVNILVGELIPKSLASVHPVRTSLTLHGFIKLFAVVFALPARILPSLAGIITKRFGADPTFAVANQAEEEIKNLVDTLEEAGEIEEDEAELLDLVFEFGDTVAREVMTPRVDMTSLPADEPIIDAAKTVVESGHSRLPVYEETDDQIIGIVHAKDILKAMTLERDEDTLRSLTRPTMAVPENKILHDLLKEMQASRHQMVVVQDEFGGTAGIVTIEDIVEEVFGEIIDEYDEDEPTIIRTGDGWKVGGKLNLDDVNDEIGTHLESGQFDTIGGYVFGLFGRQPQPGEEITVEDTKFVVMETDGRRIQTVGVVMLERELEAQSEE